MSNPRDHYLAAKYHDDEILGADASAFVPFLSLVSGISGGGAGAAAAAKPDANAQMMQMMLQQQQAQQQRDATRNQLLVVGGLGVAALGVLYLVLKKRG